MPGFIDYPLQGVMPAGRPELAIKQSFSLPVGGPLGVGGGYAQGQALGLVGGVVANEIKTATVTTNGATGMIGYWAYYADITYSGLQVAALTTNAVSAFPTAAQMQAALIAAVPLWSGNVAVTGSTGGPYSLTFSSMLAARKIGGLLQFIVSSSTGGPPTVAITVATTGCSGAFQADTYNSSTLNRFDGILQYAATPGPLGSEITEFGSTGQPRNGYTVYTKGLFQVGAIGATSNPSGPAGVVGLDANAMTLGKAVYFGGTSLTDIGVQIELR